MKAGDVEYYQSKVPFGFTLLIKEPSQPWRFDAVDTFSPSGGDKLAAILNALPAGTVVAGAAHGTAHRNIGWAGLMALQKLGSKLAVNQIGSDQTVFSHAFITVVGKPELIQEDIRADEAVSLCHFGRESFFAAGELDMASPPLPLVIFDGFKDDSALWFLDSPKDALPSSPGKGS